jgi:hypothetical protein
MLKEMHITRGTAILSPLPDDMLRVLAEDGYKYHIKSLNTVKEINLSRASEILCQRLLNIWNLNHSSLAGIHLHPDLVKKYKPAFNESQMYTGIRNEREYIWMSQILDDGHYWSYKVLKEPSHLIKIGLLDLWLLNPLRSSHKPNLILKPTGRGKLEIIPVNYHGILSNLQEKKWNRALGLSDIQSILEMKMTKKAFIHLNKRIDKSEWYDYYQKAIDRTRAEYTDTIKSINNIVRIDKTLWNQLYIFLFDSSRNESVFNHVWDRLKT